MLTRRALVGSLACLLPLLAFSFFVNLPALPIRVWDEARNANNALEIYLHHNWLVPSYDGLPEMWNTKPPLLIWAQVAAMHVVGVGELAVRLPAAIAAAATGVLLWALCSLHYGRPWTGFLAGAVLASLNAYVVNHAGRTGDYDAMLALFLTAYSLSALLYVRTGVGRWVVVFWICATLAALTKGVAGLLLLPAVLVFVVAERRALRVLCEPATYVGALGFLLVVGGYYALREHANPGYLDAVVANEIVGRYVEGVANARGPFLFYLGAIRSGEGYWIWLLLPAYTTGILSRSPEIRQLTFFNVIAVTSFWLIISGARTKMEWYSLPLFPFFSLQTGILLGMCWDRIGPRVQPAALRRTAAAAAFALVFSAPFAQAAQQVFKSQEQPGLDTEMHAQAWFLQHSIREHADLRNYVFCFRGYNAPTNFYVKLLRSRGTNVEVRDRIGRLTPGMHTVVVASQTDMLEEIEDAYRVERKGERFGCVVDTVLDTSAEQTSAHLKVLHATYGANCGAALGNATEAVRRECDDRSRCDFEVNFAQLGDPAPGCAKGFEVEWQCDDEAAPRTARLRAEAGFGSIARLRCAPSPAR